MRRRIFDARLRRCYKKHLARGRLSQVVIPEAQAAIYERRMGAAGLLAPGQASAEGGDPKKRLELVSQRRDLALVIEQFQYSEGRACKLLDMDHNCYRYDHGRVAIRASGRRC